MRALVVGAWTGMSFSVRVVAEFSVAIRVSPWKCVRKRKFWLQCTTRGAPPNHAAAQVLDRVQHP